MRRILCSLFLLLCSTSPTIATKKKPPNILLLLADDLGYGEVQGYNPSTLIQTPVLSRLQEGGMKFTDYYSGEAVCSPARCTLFTGKHTGHATVRGNRKFSDGQDFPLKANPEDTTFVQLLKQHAGYQTAMVGKWCFGDKQASPWKKGFDKFYGHVQQAAAHNMYPRYLWERTPEEEAHKILFPENNQATRERCMQTNNTCQYSHSLFVEKALDYLDGFAEDQNNPFFLFVSFTVPHAGGYTGDWKQTGNPVPSEGRYAHKTAWPEVERDHAAVITEYLDKDVGRLLDKLQDLGMADDTLVLFTSDNGPQQEAGHKVKFFNSSGPLRGFKRSLYEGGIRVPFLVQWPGRIKANVTTSEVGWFPDLYSTLSQVAGIPPQQVPANDGHSLLGVWTNGTTTTPPKDRVLYWEFCTSSKWGQALRQGDWKLVSLDRPRQPWELYNLKEDPGEKHNLAATHAVLVQKLAQEAHKAHTDDPNWPTGRSCVTSDSFERSMSFALDFS